MEATRSIGERITLSTGETVDLPLYTEATMIGVVFPVSLDPVRAFLPSCLSPVRVGPQTATVMLLCTEYHSVNRGMFEPYDEFGVLIPSTRASSTTVPLLSRFPGGVGGYVWYLPVTTEPSRALGDEIWGYPKVVGDIDITDVDTRTDADTDTRTDTDTDTRTDTDTDTRTDAGSRRRTTVTIDGDHFITVEIERPPAVNPVFSIPTESYTERNGAVVREPLTFEGEIGLWPFSTRASYTLGEHPRAEQLRQLDIGNRALVRCYGNGTFVIHPGEEIGTIE